MIDLKLLNKMLEKIPTDREIGIICIGTDRNVGDSFAPIVGTLLKDKCNIKVYGDLDRPIHALNLYERMKEVREDYIIAIDACCYKKGENDRYDLIFKNRPLSPGKGLGKSLGRVGNTSIICCVVEENENLFNGHIRLGEVYKTANLLANTIISYEKARKCGVRCENELL